MVGRLGYCISALLIISACSKSAPKPPQIFYGECRVQVESKTSGADILIDGIEVGQGSAKVQIPCGEKQVRVEREGYLPYEEYLPVTVDQPLKVTVELERLKASPDFALSSELIAQVKAGKKIRNPWLEPGVPEKEAAAEESWSGGAAASSAPAAKAADTSSSAGAATSTNVEDWR